MGTATATITREDVLKRLAELQRERNVRILYACESGSRAYGLSHSDSDYDVRFLFVRPTQDYLRVDDSKSRNDVIAVAATGKWDITGWDMRKALTLLRDSNPTLLEWLHSPVVYIGEDKEGTPSNAVVRKMRQLAAKHFSTHVCIHHYYGWLRTTFKPDSDIASFKQKKLLCILRLVLAIRWLQRRKSLVPVSFDRLVNDVFDETNSHHRFLLAECRRLANCHRNGVDMQPNDAIVEYLQLELKQLVSEKFGNRNTEKIPISVLNETFRESIKYAWE